MRNQYKLLKTKYSLIKENTGEDEDLLAGLDVATTNLVYAEQFEELKEKYKNAKSETEKKEIESEAAKLVRSILLEFGNPERFTNDMTDGFIFWVLLSGFAPSKTGIQIVDGLREFVQTYYKNLERITKTQSIREQEEEKDEDLVAGIEATIEQLPLNADDIIETGWVKLPYRISPTGEVNSYVNVYQHPGSPRTYLKQIPAGRSATGMGFTNVERIKDYDRYILILPQTLTRYQHILMPTKKHLLEIMPKIKERIDSLRQSNQLFEKSFKQFFKEEDKGDDDLLAGIDALTDLFLPKIYVCEETYCRHTYDSEYYITNSTEILENHYNPEAVQYYKDFTTDYMEFAQLIIALKEGKVVAPFNGEETGYSFCLDKFQLVENAYNTRITHGSWTEEDSRETREDDLEEVRALP